MTIAWLNCSGIIDGTSKQQVVTGSPGRLLFAVFCDDRYKDLDIQFDIIRILIEKP